MGLFWRRAPLAGGAVTPPPTAFGFTDDDFESGSLGAHWNTVAHKSPDPVVSVVTESSQKSHKTAHPAGTIYDSNQSFLECMFTYQNVTAGEDFSLVGEVVYPDEAFAAANSMYIATSIMFFYDVNNYVFLEAQAHPVSGARIRCCINDDTSGASSNVSTTPGFTIPVTPIYLKIEHISSGNDFKIYVSDDDSTYNLLWTLTGANLNSLGNKAGIAASTYHSVPASAAAWDSYCRSIKEIYST